MGDIGGVLGGDPSVAARTDFARILRVTIGTVRRGWRPIRGVPRFWVFVDGDGRLRVDRLGRRRLHSDPYADGIHSAGVLPAEVRERIGGHRCAALVCGNGWAAFRFPFQPSIDSAVAVHARHADGTTYDVHLPFEKRLLSVRFDPALTAAVDELPAEG